MPKKKQLQTPTVPSAFDVTLEDEIVDIVNNPVDNLTGFYETTSLSIDDVNYNKQILKDHKQKIALMLDGKKLREAMKVIEVMENITDILTDKEVFQRMKDNVVTAKDGEALGNLYEKMDKRISNLTRLDTIDGEGTASRFALNLQTPDGTNLSIYSERK